MRLPSFGVQAPLLLQLAVSGVWSLDQGYTTDEVEALLNQHEQAAMGRDSVSSVLDGCDLACDFLSFALASAIFEPGSPGYHLEQAAYWSQQQASDEPSCRVTPTSARDVSLALLTLELTQCPFAVKSGGHAAFSGASNIDCGVTIDLQRLNSIDIDVEADIVSIGTGLTWYEVYTALQPHGKAAIGGRVSAIGTGGLTLGGGISFMSSLYGWACDNVRVYEVVLADGSIVEVSFDSDLADLYWALRGGGSNFGIVTRMHLNTFDQGDFWAGTQAVLATDAADAAICSALEHFGVNAPSDPYAQNIIASAWVPAFGGYVWAVDLQYAKPVPFPPIFENLTSLPTVLDTLRIVSLPDLTIEFNNSNPGGFRQTYWTLTTIMDADLMRGINDIFKKHTDNIIQVNGVNPSMVYQVITTDMTKHFSVNGGNALGLENTKEPLLLLNLAISWLDESDDALIMSTSQAIISECKALAVARGRDHPYLYMNYASYQQDVLASYGPKNVARMKAVQKKYDPFGIFDERKPGYFHLPRD